MENFERIYPLGEENKNYYKDDFEEYIKVANEHYQLKCGTSKPIKLISLNFTGLILKHGEKEKAG